MIHFMKPDSRERYYISVPSNSYFKDMIYKVRLAKGNYDDYLWMSGENNAKNLLFELNKVISKHFHKKAKDEKRVLFHITMSECSHFSGLTCIRKFENPAIKKSYKECLYFEEDEREKAQCVLHNIKRCIYDFFHSSDEGEAGEDYPDWINEKWRDDYEF